MKISLTLLIILLSIISGCTQQKETSNNNNNHHTIPINENSTLYVGSTHADYRTIQEAINAAKNGATIIIENGSYNELLAINKTITLIGEDKNTTILNFNPNHKVGQVSIITINANNCSIENLQITLSNISVLAKGITINSKNNTIINNEITNDLIGIKTSGSMNNNISHNIFSNNAEYSIYLSTDSDSNKVSFNIMKNSSNGIAIQGSKYNKVYKNCITNNQIGIYCCCDAQSNIFYNNTLSKNSNHNAQDTSGKINIWYDYPHGNGNYWDDYSGVDQNRDGRGDTPYKIPNTGEEDMYPLMTPPLDVLCNQ